MLALVLSAVFVVVTLSVREQARQSVVEKLDTGHRLLARLEERHLDTLRAQTETLAGSPVLKAALDSYYSQPSTGLDAAGPEPVATLTRALETITLRLGPDVLVARDVDGAVVSSAGRRAAEWTAEYSASDHRLADGTLLALPSGVYRVLTLPVLMREGELGSIEFAQALDDRYAGVLSELSGAHTLVVADEAIRATTLPAETVAALTPGLLRTLGAAGLTTISGEEYAVRPLLDEGNAKVYVLSSVDASAAPLVAASLQRMGVIALGAFALAAVASLWLARTLARPIDTLSGSLGDMTPTRKFDRPLAESVANLDVDSVTETPTAPSASVAAIDEAFPAEAPPPRTAAQPAKVTVDELDEFGCEHPGA